MDELVDLNKERIISLDVLTRQKECVAKAYNKKVKLKVFSVIYYLWKVIFPMDQGDKTLGKWFQIGKNI